MVLRSFYTIHKYNSCALITHWLWDNVMTILIMIITGLFHFNSFVWDSAFTKKSRIIFDNLKTLTICDRILFIWRLILEQMTLICIYIYMEIYIVFVGLKNIHYQTTAQRRKAQTGCMILGRFYKFYRIRIWFQHIDARVKILYHRDTKCMSVSDVISVIRWITTWRSISRDLLENSEWRRKGWWLIILLWPSDGIWWHRSGSTLAQVMACCLRATNHYLNQCWLTISEGQW